MKKLWKAVAAIAAMGVMLTGCGGSDDGADPAAVGADPEAAIEIGSIYEPGNLSNTGGGGQGVTEALGGNVYEALIKLNDDGSISNLLAEDYAVSDDGLTYTFTLRDGVKFHSGRDLTAADVQASYEAVVAEDSQAARKSSFAVVDSVAAPDDKTVVFTLNSKSISFPYYMAYVWIVNPELGDPLTETDGTGPYTLDEWKRGSTLSLVRNDDYWGDKAKNGRVTFNYFTDASALGNALLTGQLDLVTTIQSPDSLVPFEDNDEFQISEGTSTVKELLAFNDRVAPFDDALVRKAVYSAVDREKLLNAIWDGRGTLIGSMVPPTDPWYEDLTDLNPYDPELSKELLTEAGLADGFEFELQTPNYDPHPQVAEFLKSELAKVGITVNIKTITADEWYSNVFKERAFEATLQEHVNDRDVVWYANPDFYWGYDNAEVQTLVAEAEQADSPEAQAEKLKEANRIIADEAASNWLYLFPQIVVAHKDISGFPVNGLNSQFFVYGITKG
ncbi:ABC transporter substrate-binding protein [Tessaracoccus sp. MC1865]|uniref:ABC transporter substrate-binding protein n=1 Tax=Tessaracoccus sp. MC1865 TaxID=2760310 RepID=UPI0016022A33|nr:ABC transporter substrate-binding protein [Tessaracoccus sp. MC1865]MBB1483239.1 ABC transporter substrate-binding protein [Tessaracoccus sp. MC1865]QTO37348.1 ABC transporter substrate-binding protein [Tessaracoccus sp. MC1865]